VIDEEVLHELFQENEYSDISNSIYSSNSDINRRISLCDEQSVSSDKEKMSVAATASSMAHGQSQVLRDHIFHLLANVA
jgi:hypothetical protein